MSNQPRELPRLLKTHRDSQSLMIMYAGLSGEATQKFCDLRLYTTDASYVIFEGDKQLVSGDWEEVDSDLVWNFEWHAGSQKP